MITKGIVEEIVSPYSIRVRIPSIDRVYLSNVHVPKEDLDVAVICTLPGCDINLQRGDVVIVSSDTAEEDLIILGTLYKSKKSTTLSDLELGSLIVRDHVQLPVDTSIGNLTPEMIQSFQGYTGNLKKQLDSIQEQLNAITKIISDISR